ncbi:hypothetical protein NSK_002210 [Nannochloropsis salina CCMP1776]|uniref:ABC1 atypical kinase-like domain-containing protein n=1 Tax=Nannochloropsis salina CCMP1776 TaxID=1027361 RepID=A0A4D9D977_9STRA|nr:hypothetical protein NSK_002210 [Nannochloropsis salina CCMP1776]|eukprot:TFJ86553.1 hypothetical protein NSK_002210 [Nannochloropsis salina CCMP1776]
MVTSRQQLHRLPLAHTTTTQASPLLHLPRSRAAPRRRLTTDSKTSTGVSSSQKPPSTGAAALKRADKYLGLKLMGGVLGACVGVGGIVYYYAVAEDRALKKAMEDPSIAVEPPPPEFVHPYLEKPWWWRALFAIGRAVYVASVFLPVAGMGVVSVYIFPDSKKWRERFLNALIRGMERAGCCFMKLGQWISMRPDMFPRDVVKTMARLRDGVPPHAFKHTQESIRVSFGKEIEDIFESFEETPIASGTVAQVHRARLRPAYAIHGSVQDVAVKVRHPNILNETFLDLDLIFGFVDTFFPEKYSMPCSQDELTHILRQQLDLQWEAYNLYKFSTNFRHELQSGLVHFPQVSKELCSDSILVESWVEGATIATVFSDIEGGEEHTWSSSKTLTDNFSEAVMAKKKQLAKVLFDMNVKMFLRDNYVHGDMHAGNLIVSMEDGRVTVIDAGLITSLKPDVANPFGDFLRALCNSDVDTIVSKILQFNVGKVPVDKAAFRDRIKEITEHFKNQEEDDDARAGSVVKQASAPSKVGRDGRYALGDVVGEILLSLQRFKIVLRGDVAASIMTISVSEGLILQLDPDFDMVRQALPFFVRYKGWSTAEAVMRGRESPTPTNAPSSPETGQSTVAA